MKPILGVVAALAAAIATRNIGTPDRYPMLGLLALAAVGVVWLFVRYLKWATTNFVLTSERVVYRTGVLAKHSREIPLERINDIATTQSLFNRIVGAGDVLIESGGERGQQVIGEMPKPFRVQNDIYKAIEDAGTRSADRAVGERPLTIPEQIEKLDELRARGVISQAEFDVKKSQLLERM